MCLLVKGGRLIDPAEDIDEVMDLLIRDGRVVERGKDLSPPPGEVKVIDAEGKAVAPGFIDIGPQLREPGFEYKEDIASGTRAAAAGGFTALAPMPNTRPVNDNAAVTEFILRRAREVGSVQVLPIGAISQGTEGEGLSEMGDMRAAGAIAFSDGERPLRNSTLMRRALEYALMLEAPVISCPEDPSLAAGGLMHEGFVSTELGLPGIPREAEEIMAFRDMKLAELTGARLHLAHISSRGTVRLVREAKERGVKVTCSVTPHHLCLADGAVRGYDVNAKVRPPLREREDQQALLEGLRDGTIDLIATAHAPHDVGEREVEFQEAEAGIVGLETALPLLMDRLVSRGILTLGQLVEKLSTNPARTLGLPKGTLKPGADGDLTILDPEAEVIVNVGAFCSKGKNSPFHGWRLKGRVLATVVGGRVVAERWE